MIMFIIGLLIGIYVGMFIMALLSIASKTDKKAGYKK